jgi:putative endonuclease
MSAAKPTQPTGQRGEQLAASYLKKQGYHIITTNWRCKLGEIDIVARQNETLVFVEVRTRHAPLPEAAFESIRSRKQERLVKAAHLYLSTHHLDDISWRVDVIAIAVPQKGDPLIEHVQDALEW